ncbi:MAG: decarboxylating 6-phosphogluconate dehydrogenase [Gammaproteobacteria bacterium]|nr:decarboxylating 6-phosphogluconate dehydrogenase [Gammaproteobacteria bacterium]NNJ92232.1 decarboxylating 6-phosphogluconate dehydrogenase [Gammaproteobacteria bacterium]
MQLGMIGLGRMGANMVTRLLRQGHECVVYDTNPDAVNSMAGEGAIASKNLAEFCNRLEAPRNIWIMVPAVIVERVIDELIPLLAPGDTIIDGGNSNYRDDISHADQLKQHDIHFIDCGTSGGVLGLERGYCLMIGGETEQVKRLDPIFKSLAPGSDNRHASPAQQGYLHCGPSGAGHFVKMVHNGIEYALMAAYAEGFNLLKHANAGKQNMAEDAETAPMENAEYYQYDFNVADIAEVWRKGSVISSWLLDLTANALKEDVELSNFGGKVSDSGEGRWTSLAAIETGTPAPLLTTALYERFTSRDESDYANKLLSAMRFQFGGHHEKKD